MKNIKSFKKFENLEPEIPKNESFVSDDEYMDVDKFKSLLSQEIEKWSPSSQRKRSSSFPKPTHLKNKNTWEDWLEQFCDEVKLSN